MTENTLGSSSTDLRVLSQLSYDLINTNNYFYDLFLELINVFYFERVRGIIFRLSCVILLVAYCFMIIVSGGIFLAVVLLPFLGYKFYKKVLSKCGAGVVPNALLFCCPRRRTEGDYGNFLRKKIVPRVELNFPSALRVGETISFRVVVRLK